MGVTELHILTLVITLVWSLLKYVHAFKNVLFLRIIC